jgi:hypothetical protein
MPVIDHPVHEHGIRDSEHRYGCHNRPARFVETVHSGNMQTSWPFRMSHECRYDRSNTDSACAGCKYANIGHKYVTRDEAVNAR